MLSPQKCGIKDMGVKYNFECSKKFQKGFVKKNDVQKKSLFKKILIPKIILSSKFFSWPMKFCVQKTFGSNEM